MTTSNIKSATFSRPRDGGPRPRRRNTSLSLRPDDISVLIQLSRALTQIDKSDEAILLAERAINLEPDNASLYHHLGGLFALLERWQEAATAQLRALELQPTDAAAAAQLTMLWPGQGIWTTPSSRFNEQSVFSR